MAVICRPFWPLPPALILIGTVGLFAQTVTPTTIDVTDYRPLALALDNLEQQIHIPINYEDPPCENPAELEDTVPANLHAVNPNGHWWVCKKGNVSAVIDTTADPLASIGLLLTSYRDNSLPGDFTVENANGMLYVTATKVLSVSGQMKNIVSPFSLPVSVPEGTRTVGDTIGVILKSIRNQTGMHIGIGRLHFYPAQQITFSAAEAPARDVLAALLDQAGKESNSGRRSYRLLYSLSMHQYMLNLQPISGTAVKPAGSLAVAPSVARPVVAYPPFLRPIQR